MTPILSPWTRSEPKKNPAPKSLRERVLVVEDELIIGEIATEVLTNAGYEVFTAASAEEAEIILRDVSVDVLFTDIDLGGRDGFELAQTALSLQPLVVDCLDLRPLADLPWDVRESGSAFPRQALPPHGDGRDD